MRRLLVATLTITTVAALAMAAGPTWAKVRNDGRLPERPLEAAGDRPYAVVALGGDGETVQSQTFTANRRGPVWVCTYLAVKAVAGSGFEVGLDVMRGPITPTPGELVALSCSTDGALQHQEISSFDPDDPLGSIDVAAAPTTGIADVVARVAVDLGAAPDAAPPSPPPPAP